MEVDPSFWGNPRSLSDMWVSTSGGALSGTELSAAAVGDFSVGTPAPATGSSASAGGGAPAGTLGGATLLSACSSAQKSTTSTSVATSSSAAPTNTAAGSITYGSQPAATICTSGSSSATSGTVVGGAAAATAGSTTSLDLAAQNAQQNALTNSGRGSASTGTSVSTTEETMVPLAAFAHYAPSITPMQVMHQGPFSATTISFNLPVGESLGTATAAIDRTLRDLHVPISIHGAYAGTAQVFQQTLANEVTLSLAAIAAVYIVLGILYESFVHPITILSTLPSGGVGAVLALLLFNTEFSLVALIGVFLLIGIVKKNAIMMIDVAIDIERHRCVEPREAIYAACLLRFRPIMMTTFAALLGAVPLAVTVGNGAELRQPLGISIVGGLLVSQILTLYTTPVVYLYLDRLRLWVSVRLLHRPARNAAPQHIMLK